MSTILIVLSAASQWTRANGEKYDSGYWAGEFVDIHEKLVAAGCKVDLATPGGVTPTADPHSLNPDVAGPEASRYAEYLKALDDQLKSPLVLADVDVSEFDAVVVPGGHGPVEDLFKDPDMGRVLVEADKSQKVIGSVCHGPAALLSAKDAQGEFLFAGRRLTAFTDEEERDFGTADNAPWLLADTLRKSGARFEQGPNWQPYVVRDGNLISGQNPQSSEAVAEAVLEALS